MPGEDDFEAAFRALMAQEGVTPLESESTAARPAEARPRPTRRRQSSPAAAVIVDGDRDQRRDGQAAETAGMLAAARAELDGLRDRLEAAHREVDRLRAELAANEQTREALDTERRALARQVQALHDATPPAAPLDVPAVLTARGLPTSVHADALSALLQTHPDATLGALDGTDPDALPRLVDQRLVATCGEGWCGDVDESAAFVIVAPADCELCGGRQGGAALTRLQTVCAARGIHRIVVVGGSPNTRTALRDLAADGPLRIETVDGTSKPAARKVKRLERTTDLVVIWAGTILDHATTAAFQAVDRPTETIPYRGVARMLEVLGERLGRAG